MNIYLVIMNYVSLTLIIIPDISLPEGGETYKFKQLQAVEKAPFICYYDTKAKYVGCNDMKNILNRHETVTYLYVIFNKKKRYIMFQK